MECSSPDLSQIFSPPMEYLLSRIVVPKLSISDRGIRLRKRTKTFGASFEKSSLKVIPFRIYIMISLWNGIYTSCISPIPQGDHDV